MKNTLFLILIVLILLALVFQRRQSAQTTATAETQKTRLATPEEQKYYNQHKINIVVDSADHKRLCSMQTFDEQFEVKICRRVAEDQLSTNLEVLVVDVTAANTIYQTTLVADKLLIDSDYAFDLQNSVFIFSWISGNTERKQPNQIHLQGIDLKTRNVLFDQIVVQNNWGLGDLAVALHPLEKSVHLAYRDISQKTTAQQLFLQRFDFAELAKNQPVTETPVVVEANTSWDKTSPHFYKSNHQLYFSYRTGQRLGAFASGGEPMIAIQNLQTDNTSTQFGFPQN